MNMYEKRFAITRTVGNDEVVLKHFGENKKEAAMTYGAEAAKDNTEGIISCILTMIDTKSGKMSSVCRVYNVWFDETKYLKS